MKLRKTKWIGGLMLALGTALVALSLIPLPTLTPEDTLTTVPLYINYCVNSNQCEVFYLVELIALLILIIGIILIKNRGKK